MPWLPRVLPNIVTIVSAHPEKTVFTRFIPAQRPGQGVGMWQHYYRRRLEAQVPRNLGRSSRRLPRSVIWQKAPEWPYPTLANGSDECSIAFS